MKPRPSASKTSTPFGLCSLSLSLSVFFYALLSLCFILCVLFTSEETGEKLPCPCGRSESAADVCFVPFQMGERHDRCGIYSSSHAIVCYRLFTTTTMRVSNSGSRGSTYNYQTTVPLSSPLYPTIQCVYTLYTLYPFGRCVSMKSAFIPLAKRTPPSAPLILFYLSPLRIQKESVGDHAVRTPMVYETLSPPNGQGHMYM